MAELAAKLAKPGSEECPICMIEVPSIKILPCSHTICERCISKLSEKQSEFSCPVCRKTQTGTDSITKYFGELRCCNCMKMKDVDEYFWCCNCRKLICCRCIAKEHGFDHQLLEWNTKEAFLACFQTLGGSHQLNKDMMEKNLQLILKPLVTDARILLEEKFAMQNDIAASLAKSYGLDSETIRFGKTMKNCHSAPKLLQTLGCLVGLDITSDFSMMGAPSGIRNRKRVLDVLMEELEFSHDLKNQTKDKYSQTEKIKESVAVIPNPVTDKPKTSKNLFISKSRETNSFVTSTKKSLMFGPFDLKEGDKFIIGPTDSFAVLMRDRAAIFQRKVVSEKPSLDFSVRSIETNNLKFIDASLDGNETLHLVAMNSKSLFYYNDPPTEAPYSIEITPELSAKEKVVDACITCTITGVPYLFVVIEGTNSFKTALYKFGARPGAEVFERYGLAKQVFVQPDSYIKSACAVRVTRTDVWIIGADSNGIHIFLKHNPGAVAVEYFKFIPIKFAQLCSVGDHKQTVIIRKVTPNPCELRNTLCTPQKTCVRYYTIESGEFTYQKKKTDLESNTCFVGTQKESLLQFCTENSCGSGMFVKKL